MAKQQHKQPGKSAEDFQYIPNFEEPPESSLKEYLEIDEKALMPGKTQEATAQLCVKVENLKKDGELPNGADYENNPEYTRVNPIGREDGFTKEDLALNKKGECEWTNVQLILSNCLGDNPVIASSPDTKDDENFVLYVKKGKKKRS